MNLRKQLSSYIALNNYVEAFRENTSSIVLTDAITNGLTDLQLKGSEVKNKPEMFLDSVVAKGGTEQRNLPAEYTQLEYITFSSGAYIKTGIVPKTFDYEVGFKGAFGILSGGPNCAWGYMDDSLIPRWVCATYQNRYLLNANTTIGFGDADTNTHTFVGRVYEKNNGYCWSSEFDGVIQQNDQTLDSSSAWEANTLEIYVGARNNSETAGNHGLITANHWWCKKAGVMIADYIPAKRNSDNVLGMYDLISNTFFTNQGTGSFTAGPEVVPTPDTPIDITSNNGVLKVSPNLFDKNASYALFGGYINNASVGENTTLMTYGGGDKTIIIKVAPNTTYTVTRVTNLGSVYNRIRCAAFTALPSNGSTGVILCNYMNKTQANATFTTLSDTQYVAINVRNSGAVGDDWTQFVDAFQLEQGSTATQYRPYRQIYTDGTVETIKDSLNNTATVEMLLKVGDYQDEQEILSGTVTRKIGIKVFDGTENWTQGAASPTFKASLPIEDSKPKDSQDMLCSHFKSVKTNVTSAVQNNQCAMFTPGGSSTYDKLVIGKYDIPNLTAWKQWLADQYAAGTPVIVVYPLNASTTETVSPQKLLKNPVTVTEASIDNLEVTTTEAEHTVPTPDYPLDIVCNNGVLKAGSDNSIIVEGTPETVTITGKNLFNESHIKSAAINDVSVVIPVKQNKTYTWSYNKTEYDFRFDSEFIWGVDLNGSKVENGVTLVYANGTYTTASYVTVTVVSSNVVALQTVFRNNTIQSTKENVLASSMQLEEGIRPTKYEEYYQASFAPEDLLKLSDYQDVQSVLDGIVTRNVGVKVLDGTENWTASSNYFGSCYTYVLGETPVGQVICSHFQNTSSLSDYSRGKCYKETGAFNLWYGDNIATASADLKQFLADQYAAGTPVIVVYTLANTVEETVESRDVFITSGTNTIERNSEYVSSDGITVKYKKLR